jgi:hypothetical protein
MATRLDTASNIATILLACVGVTMLVMRFTQPAAPARPGMPEPYKTGEQLKGISTIDFTKASTTVVLYVRSTCHFCTESMPFYQKLKDAIDSRKTKVQMAVVSFEPLPVTRGYLQQHAIQLGEEEIFQLKEGETRLSGTPTILLVDQKGVVKSSMMGKLPPEKESQLLATLAKS